MMFANQISWPCAADILRYCVTFAVAAPPSARLPDKLSSQLQSWHWKDATPDAYNLSVVVYVSSKVVLVLVVK